MVAGPVDSRHYAVPVSHRCPQRCNGRWIVRLVKSRARAGLGVADALVSQPETFVGNAQPFSSDSGQYLPFCSGSENKCQKIPYPRSGARAHTCVCVCLDVCAVRGCPIQGLKKWGQVIRLKHGNQYGSVAAGGALGRVCVCGKGAGISREPLSWCNRAVFPPRGGGSEKRNNGTVQPGLSTAKQPNQRPPALVFTPL